MKAFLIYFIAAKQAGLEPKDAGTCIRTSKDTYYDTYMLLFCLGNRLKTITKLFKSVGLDKVVVGCNETSHSDVPVISVKVYHTSAVQAEQASRAYKRISEDLTIESALSMRLYAPLFLIRDAIDSYFF